jgi:tRNA (cmo5U34)-methyltransferase
VEATGRQPSLVVRPKRDEEMKKDATFKWDDKDFVNFYTDSANFIVLERQRSIRILLEIAAFHFPSLSGLHILDLGCGEGIITKYIYDKSPDNNFYLLDASEEMLNKARGNLTSSKSNISFSHRTFEDYSTSQSEDWKYDFVFSANAIHHLDFTQKTALYTKIYKELKPGGLFLNIDAVHPSSAHSEEIQFQLWRNWMNETLEKNGKESELGKYDNIPSLYKNNLEDRPSGLWDQLQALSRCGFRDVDCFYKYSIFAVFGGTK